MSRAALLLATALLFLLGAHGPSCGADAPVEEARVKAVMTLNIAKFLDWPAEAFPSATAPLTICVIGKGGYPQASEALGGKTVKGRNVTVRSITRTEAPDSCQLLVVGESERSRIPAILDWIGRRPVASISDLSGFAVAGGMFALVEQGGRVRIEANIDTAHHAGIRINPQLLSLATIVHGGIR